MKLKMRCEKKWEISLKVIVFFVYCTIEFI